MLNKIKDTFTDIQKQLFVSSFYCFLNYDSKKDFIVNFDHIWKWLGFSRKDHAKTVLNKNFVIDSDYKVENIIPEVSGKIEKGRPCEKIMLTVNAFKKFCLKAGTKKADEVHDYYIKLEELLHETLNEESNELRKQLEEKTFENKKSSDKIEKRSERKKEKFSEMTEEEKEEKINKAKEYREQNKEKKDMLSKQKIICLVCQTKLSRSCWRRHTKSLLHLDAVKLNPDVIEKYEIEN